MLDHLVAGVVCATANDPGLLPSLVVLDADGVLADVLEPHELEVAVAVAVNTLGLVLANDHVAKGRAGAEEEDGVSASWERLELASLFGEGCWVWHCLDRPLPRSDNEFVGTRIVQGGVGMRKGYLTSLSLVATGAASAVEPRPSTVVNSAGRNLNDLAIRLGRGSRRHSTGIRITRKGSRHQSRKAGELG